MLDHQADGIATRDGSVQLVEVELTAKSAPRYRPIYENHARRLTQEGISKVVYFCTADAYRVVSREADRFIFRTERPRLVATIAFDKRGHWIGSQSDLVTPAQSTPGVPEIARREAVVDV